MRTNLRAADTPVPRSQAVLPCPWQIDETHSRSRSCWTGDVPRSPADSSGGGRFHTAAGRRRKICSIDETLLSSVLMGHRRTTRPATSLARVIGAWLIPGDERIPSDSCPQGGA